MFRNYMTMAFRSLLKNKLISLINISGLSIALASAILAMVFAHSEWTYDLFHANVDRIFRVRLKIRDQVINRTPLPLGPAIASEMPDVKVVRVRKGRRSIENGENSFRVSVNYVDPSFLEVFSFPMLMGDASTALRDLHSIVITKDLARKLFQDVSPLGRVVILNTGVAYKVSGVLSTLPENSSIVFDCLLPFNALGESRNSWKVFGASTFVLLPSYMERRYCEDRLPAVVRSGWGNKATATISLLLQPYNEVHLDQYRRGVEPTSNPIYMYVFLGVSLSVIAISCVNYSALTIGRTFSRAKEAGVRRLLGAERRQLVSQYLMESGLLVLLALIVGLGLVGSLLPSFSSVVGRKLSLTGQLNVVTSLCILLLTASIGLLAGLYPALALSRLQSVKVLYARAASVKSGSLMRLLLVTQFAMSMVLIMATVAMAAQLNLLVTKNPGFRTDGVIVVDTGRLLETSAGLVDVYEGKIASYPNIIGVARGQHPLSNRQAIIGFVKAEGRIVDRVENIAVDYGFLKTLEFKLLEGRDFSRLYSIDPNAVIINQALMRRLGWQTAANKVVDWNAGKDAPIIGVVRDFHFKSFHEKVAPAVIFLKPEFCRKLYIVSTSDEGRRTLDILRKEWHEIVPSQAFRARFIEDDLKIQYKKDENWLHAVQLSAILALGIACLGAFSLTSFSVDRRTKEIGIRKVFGATVPRLMAYLSFDFIKIVILAAIIAVPIVYFFLKEWLRDFVYRIDLIVPIIAGGLLTFAFVVFTVSSKTYRAATLNPAKTLNSD